MQCLVNVKNSKTNFALKGNSLNYGGLFFVEQLHDRVPLKSEFVVECLNYSVILITD